MKIALLGGSFDPPHLGHLFIAHQIIELAGIDQVWFLPNHSTLAHHKVFQKKLSSSYDRLMMVRLVENGKIIASDFELENNKESLTSVTLEKLTKQFPKHTFYWITGSDKLETFHLWDDWKKIVTNYHLIIFPRGEQQESLDELVKKSLKLQTIPGNVIVLDSKELLLTNISSTSIRERVKKNLQIDFLVPSAVEKYIKEHKLYA